MDYSAWSCILHYALLELWYKVYFLLFGVVTANGHLLSGTSPLKSISCILLVYTTGSLVTVQLSKWYHTHVIQVQDTSWKQKICILHGISPTINFASSMISFIHSFFPPFFIHFIYSRNFYIFWHLHTLFTHRFMGVLEFLGCQQDKKVKTKPSRKDAFYEKRLSLQTFMKRKQFIAF